MDALETAFELAKNDGKLRLAEGLRPASGPTSATMMVQVAQGAGLEAAEEEWMRTAPLADVRRYLEARYPNGR